MIKSRKLNLLLFISCIGGVGSLEKVRAQQPGSPECPVWMEYYSRETKKEEKHCFQNLEEAMKAKRKAEGDMPDHRDPAYLQARVPKSWHSDYESWLSHK